MKTSSKFSGMSFLHFLSRDTYIRLCLLTLSESEEIDFCSIYLSFIKERELCRFWLIMLYKRMWTISTLLELIKKVNYVCTVSEWGGIIFWICRFGLHKGKWVVFGDIPLEFIINRNLFSNLFILIHKNYFEIRFQYSHLNSIGW